jgi:thiol peroxidase
MAELMEIERAGEVTIRGKPAVLLGSPVQVGDPAPDFAVVDASYVPVRLSQFHGKPVLINVVPSLETLACATQTKRFDDVVGKLPAGIVIMTVSMDLPFAQKRFCGQHEVTRILVLSDSARREFGVRYGVLLKDRGLLARSVFVVNGKGVVVYRQLVKEMTRQPDYNAALHALRKAAAE